MTACKLAMTTSSQEAPSARFTEWPGSVQRHQPQVGRSPQNQPLAFEKEVASIAAAALSIFPTQTLPHKTQVRRWSLLAATQSLILCL